MNFEITIPVLNEEATLEQNAKILHGFLKGHFPDGGQWRIVIADNGSTDRTLEIARALASNPHFILLDEPFAGIDPIAVGDIRDLVMHLKDRGIGVLITDHNVRETLDVIDRAYIIHDGMMLMEGAPSDIVGNEDVRRVYLGDRFSL